MYRLNTPPIGPDEHITIETRMTNLRDIITITQNESFETITCYNFLWIIFLFRSEFFFRTTRELQYIFFPEINIRLYDKNSESDFFFFLHQKSSLPLKKTEHISGVILAYLPQVH
jgi:hypothetical protein